MLFVKMMGEEDLPDTSLSKTFSILQVENIDALHFLKEAEDNSFNKKYPFTLSIKRNGETVENYVVKGNTYVMSENGKTIAKFSPNSFK